MVRSVILASLAASLIVTSTAGGGEPSIAKSAEQTKPIEQGTQIPDATLWDAKGEETTLKRLTEGKTTVLVFFRGGWCPICTRHTAQLIKAYPQIQSKGAQLVAISPDSPASTSNNKAKNSIPFAIYSDSDLKASKAFGLAFQVDDATVKKYKGFGIDLESASGRDHHALPIPAVYIVDATGKIVFAHSDLDYKNRLDPASIIEKLP
ncbi:peroxiredoxin-like family protein [Stieleria varia]|uniref:thioredoxin-dependent peroxiredoxin n=1 Tax=Stieleria varia TaxID=2528005 RepID=A0A5C6B2I0_9BACT|nr:peroxiredoxin-like family protein [Stieleria varia]TWU06138.1 putative peroxiredoxin bcp [Stieleria varia]